MGWVDWKNKEKSCSSKIHRQNFGLRFPLSHTFEMCILYTNNFQQRHSPFKVNLLVIRRDQNYSKAWKLFFRFLDKKPTCHATHIFRSRHVCTYIKTYIFNNVHSCHTHWIVTSMLDGGTHSHKMCAVHSMFCWLNFAK